MAKTQDEIKNFLENLIKSLGAKIDDFEIKDDVDTGMTTACISSPDGRILIGKDGEALNAINTLLHRYIDSDGDTKGINTISVDVNNFQKTHIDTLKTKAHMMAERAKFFKSSIDLEPMNGYERRIVHTFLEKDKNIITDSTGEGKNRHIVVKFVEYKTAI